MASTAATPKPTDTTESDAATRLDTAHANSRGLENSPLGRLAPELRNEIFSLALTPSNSRKPERDDISLFFRNFGIEKTTPNSCPEISCALMATCKQIGSETENLFLSLNDIRVRRRSLYSTVQQVERIVPLLRRVPRSLVFSGRVFLPVRCYYRKDSGLDSQWDGGGLNT